jgi:hypothetical protein
VPGEGIRGGDIWVELSSSLSGICKAASILHFSRLVGSNKASRDDYVFSGKKKHSSSEGDGFNHDLYT